MANVMLIGISINKFGETISSIRSIHRQNKLLTIRIIRKKSVKSAGGRDTFNSPTKDK